MSNLLIIIFTVSEVILLIIVILFFLRLKKSETLLSGLQANQEGFIKRLQFNTQLENELVATFEQRQQELVSLNRELENKSVKLKKLVDLASEYCKSPQFMREIILKGNNAGKSAIQLAKSTGLSLEEVELIIDQS
jgi:cell shape-determining protein MreC